MTPSAIAYHPDATRQREFRRLLIISLAAHLVGFAALAWMPTIPTPTPPGAIAVNLVAAPTTVAPPAPAPPRARPKPRPPKKAPVVLPKEPTTPKVVKAKPAPKPVEKPPPEPEVVEERDLSDILSDLRSEAGEDTPVEAKPQPVQTAALGAGGTGPPVPVSPEVLAWIRKARIHVRQSWVVPPSFQMQELVTKVEVDLDAEGGLRGKPSVKQRSGNPYYDEGVVRSIQKASPLPAPPKEGRWTFVFVSDEDL